MISKIGLGAFLSLVPELESHEGSFGEHDLEVSGRTVTIGPYNYSPLPGRISSCIYDSELIFSFNWSVVPSMRRHLHVKTVFDCLA